MERQLHGFEFENIIKEKYGIITKEDSTYTSEWDGYYNEIPVSIKTKKLGCAIEMSDFFRNAYKKEDFILIVGFWEGSKNNIVEEHTLYINKNYWVSQFDENLVEEFKHIFDGISNSKEDDEKWKERMTCAKNKWKETNSIINVHFKRDHKAQKRVQCSIKNKEFYSVLLKYYTIELVNKE